MDIAAARSVIELVDGVERRDGFPLQGGELGNLSSQSIAAPLQKKAEERIRSTLHQLLLYLGTIDKCLIPKQEDSHLSHLGVVLERCGKGPQWKGQVIRVPEKAASITASIQGAVATAILVS